METVSFSGRLAARLTKNIFTGAVVALGLIASSQSVQAEGPLDGLYIVGLGGYERYGLDLESGGVNIDLGHISSAGGGVVLGWDLEVDDWHLAVEGEFTFSGASLSETVDVGGDIYTASLDIKRTLGLAARYGYAFGGDALLYGRIGWSKTNLEATAAGPGFALTASTNLNGLSYGAGLEWAITTRVSLRGEYIRTNYEKILGEPLEPSRDAFRGGIALRF